MAGKEQELLQRVVERTARALSRPAPGTATEQERQAEQEAALRRLQAPQPTGRPQR